MKENKLEISYDKLQIKLQCSLTFKPKEEIKDIYLLIIEDREDLLRPSEIKEVIRFNHLNINRKKKKFLLQNKIRQVRKIMLAKRCKTLMIICWEIKVNFRKVITMRNPKNRQTKLKKISLKVL